MKIGDKYCWKQQRAILFCYLIRGLKVIFIELLTLGQASVNESNSTF